IQNELDLSRSRYFELYELAPEGYLTISELGLILEANLTAINMIGLKQNNLKGQMFSQFVYKEDQDIFYKHRKILFETKEPQECDFRIVRKNGTMFWSHIKAVFVTNESFTFCRLILSDISKRMNALNELKESEEKYRLVYSSMSQGMALHEIITDNSGRPIDYIYLDINDSYETLLKVKRENVIGKKITEVMPKVEPYWIENFGNVALTGISTEYKNYLETTGRYYNTYTYRTKPRQFAVLVTDVTDQIKVLEQLKQNEKNLLESQRIAHVGTWRLNVQTNEVVWTEELYKMYGFDPTLPPPSYIEHSKLFTPDSWEKLSTALEMTSSQGIPYELELETVTKDGSHGWVWVRGEAEKDKDGQIVAVWGAAQDITERLNTLNRLKESEQRLDMFFKQSLTGFFVMRLDEPVYWNETVNKEEILNYIFDHQRCTRVNQALLNQYGINLEDFLNKTPRDLFAHNIDSGKDAWRQMLDHGSIHTITDERKVDGTPIIIEGDYVCMYDSLGRFIGHFGNQEDVTHRVQKQKEIEYLSCHDHLTDLYNRRYFLEQFNQHNKLEYLPLGIMMMDLNGLKIINDAFGHKAGDMALKKLGHVLKDTFKQKDTVSRIGGDEYAVLLPNTSLKELEDYKEQIASAIRTMKVDNIELSIAIGYELKKKFEEDIDDVLKAAENRMYKHKSAIGSSGRSRAINAILNTLTDKYGVERVHSERVSYLCKLVGQQLKLKEEGINELKQAGLFHDIGKISIPDSILNKPEKLTDEEYDIIKTHTEVGYQILRAADEYSDLAIHALHHHERWDGKGYPTALEGNDIPLFSRIICVVDAYEAMTADRPYRKRLTKEHAIAEIRKCSGTQFDPKIAKIFIEQILRKEDGE
ncbi:MAG: HD domain-containing phosphohydrolase, partial [Bacilli bacterium]